MKLSILMPVYNERLYLAEIFRRVTACPLPSGQKITALELVVVDDCSTDGTREWLESRAHAYETTRADGVSVSVKLLFQSENQGKGSAIQRAIRESTGDIVIVQDCDLEYSPTDFPKLLQPIVDGVADAVIGSRFLGETHRVLFYWHSVVNKILTMFSNMASDLNLTDMETCYKAISGPLARSLRLTSRRFGFEPEVVARLSQVGARIYEVPVQYHGRTYEEGKKIGVKDGIAAFWHVLKYNYLDKNPVRDETELPILLKSQKPSRLDREQFKKALLNAGVANRSGLKILEIGSGQGDYTQYLLKHGDVLATDRHSRNVDSLRSRFGYCETFRAQAWDFSEQPPSEVESHGPFDLIVVSQSDAPERLQSLLAPNGVKVLRSTANSLVFSGSKVTFSIE